MCQTLAQLTLARSPAIGTKSPRAAWSYHRAIDTNKLLQAATAKQLPLPGKNLLRKNLLRSSKTKRKDVHRLSRNEDRQNKSSPKYASLGRQVGVLRLTFIVHAHREESGVLSIPTPLLIPRRASPFMRPLGALAMPRRGFSFFPCAIGALRGARRARFG